MASARALAFILILFRSREIVKKDGVFDVPPIMHPFWWCMYHTFGRAERWLERRI